MSRLLCDCHRPGIDPGLHEEGAHGCRTAIQANAEGQPTGEARVIPIEGGHISAVAAELMDTLIKKNADYAPTTEFSNFEQAAEFAGLEEVDVMMTQIGIKLTRIKGLHHDSLRSPNNESLRDSLVDLAGYAVIAAAWLDAVQGDQHG